MDDVHARDEGDSRPGIQRKLLDLAEAEYTGDTLVPVWFMSMKSRNRVLYAVQNGVTGDMWADKPLDIPRFAGLTAVLAVILAAVTAGTYYGIRKLVYKYAPRTWRIKA